MNALVTQASKLDLSSRAFYSGKFGEYAEYATQYFGYERLLPMNTGAEAVETALKLARKWGYKVKGIPDEQAVIVVCRENFHGRTISIVSMSTDPSAKSGFGPYTPGFVQVDFGDLAGLQKVLEGPLAPRIAAFLVEPIQGEAGVKIPPAGYLRQARELCKYQNVLFMTDEIQSGLGRAGRLLAYCLDCEGCEHHANASKPCLCTAASKSKPDVLILGKALSGGMYPVSAVLADHHVMNVIGEGEHGSTYGGNAIASAVAIEALKVLKEEKLVENSDVMGERFRDNLRTGLGSLDFVADIRGRGLFNAVEISPQFDRSAWQLCLALGNRGILCKPTHDNIIRLTPPLCVTSEQIDHASQVIVDVFKAAKTLQGSDLLEDPTTTKD